MATQTLTVTTAPVPAFPTTEVKRRLRVELLKIADDASVLRPEWEPLLDSMRVVGTLLVIEDLFPDIKIRPDKMVRKGGYNSVNEALSDMLPRIEREVTERRKPRGRT
jgi:hypothetical protein